MSNQPPPPGQPDAETWHVYEVQPGAWMLARNEAEAMETAKGFFNGDIGARKLDAWELDNHTYYDDPGSETGERTFVAQLAIRIASNPEPDVFATIL